MANECPQFFERQVEARCGMHALNNVVGEAIFTTDDMSHAIDVFLEENADLADDRSAHERPGGWYSVEVMATALRSTFMAKRGRIMYELRLEALHASPYMIDVQEVVGAIVNRAGQHWFALRREGASIWKLDSMQRGPVQLSRAEYLALVQTHIAYPIKKFDAVADPPAMFDFGGGEPEPEDEDVFGFGGGLD